MTIDEIIIYLSASSIHGENDKLYKNIIKYLRELKELRYDSKLRKEANRVTELCDCNREDKESNKLIKLKELAQKATQGEWKVCKETGHIVITLNNTNNAINIKSNMYPFVITPSPNRENNAAFVVAANPKMILELVDKIECLEKQIDWLKKR